MSLGAILDYHKAISLFDARNTKSIQEHILSADSSSLIARELSARMKLTQNLHELCYLLPILVKAIHSSDPEVIEATVHGLARFATERWQDYESECLPHGIQEVFITLIERKHKGIRKFAAQVLIATALQTEQLALAHYPLNHVSSKLRMLAIGTLISCRQARIDIGPLILLLVEKMTTVDKKERKAVLNVLNDWVSESPPTAQHFNMLKIVRDQLHIINHAQCTHLAREISTFLETHACADDIDRLFEQLTSNHEVERRTATQQMYPLFNTLVVISEDVASQLAHAFTNKDPQVREDMARIVTNAEWKRGKALSLLTHSDEAIRKGAMMIQSAYSMSAQVVAPWIEKIEAAIENRRKQAMALSAPAMSPSTQELSSSTQEISPSTPDTSDVSIIHEELLKQEQTTISEHKANIQPKLVSLSNKTLTFSGRFSRSKSDLEILATLASLHVSKSVTKNCDILVAGHKSSVHTTEESQAQGLQIISEAEFLAALEAAMPPMNVFVEFIWSRKWDISYYGNESDGLCGSFSMPWPKTIKRSKSALMRVARENELVKKYLDSGREEALMPEPSMKPLDPKRADFGWIRSEPKKEMRRNIIIKRRNKKQKYDRLSSVFLWEMLEKRIDQLDVLAIHASREIESIIAVHLIGGRDRVTGELTGIILQRVWT